MGCTGVSRTRVDVSHAHLGTQPRHPCSVASTRRGCSSEGGKNSNHRTPPGWGGKLRRVHPTPKELEMQKKRCKKERRERGRCKKEMQEREGRERGGHKKSCVLQLGLVLGFAGRLARRPAAEPSQSEMRFRVLMNLIA